MIWPTPVNRQFFGELVESIGRNASGRDGSRSHAVMGQWLMEEHPVDHRIHLNFATTVVVVGLGLGVSVVTSAAVAARAYQARGDQAVRADQTICVKGSVRQRIRSDRAVWRVSVQGEGKELKEAFTVLDHGGTRVREFLKQRSFSDAETAVEAIDTVMHHARDAKGNEMREIAGYTLSRTLTVTTADVDRVASAAGDVTQLIQEGVLVLSRPPEYYYTDLARLKIDMMGAASKDARARAEEIARNAGCRVAEVRSAHMGVLQITRPFSTDTSDGGVFDTSTVEKDVQAVVTVTFRIESQ